MLIRLAAPCTQDSIADGPGLRMVVWTQGCPHNCKGCHNPNTHNPADGFVAEVIDVLRDFDSNPLLAGVTISGGEPFMQAAACAEIARRVKERDKNVWLYTGYTLEKILAVNNKDWLELLSEIDVLVDGPYLEHLKNLDLAFRGSDSQRIIRLKDTKLCS